MIEDAVLDWARGADELVDEFLEVLGEGEVIELNTDTDVFCDQVAPEDEERVRAALAAPGQVGYAVVRHRWEHLVVVAHAAGSVIGRLPKRRYFFGMAQVPGSEERHAVDDSATLCGVRTFDRYRSPFFPYSTKACTRCRDVVLSVFGLPDPPGPIADVVARTPPGSLRDTVSEALAAGADRTGWRALTAGGHALTRFDDLVEGREAAAALTLSRRAVAEALVEDSDGDFLILVSPHATVLARYATGGNWYKPEDG